MRHYSLDMTLLSETKDENEKDAAKAVGTQRRAE
jgi:hypothetical protein